MRELGGDQKRVLRIDEPTGVPQGSVEIERLLDQRDRTVVRHVGEPNPARTHFRARINRVKRTGICVFDYVPRTANDTLRLSRTIGDALRDAKSAGDYGPFELSQSLRLVAEMIAAEVPTRVYSVTLAGFDTHAAQANRHAALLQELSQALAAFHKDLKARGHLDRTLVMTFSEFGRRVAENRSAGTDHGTANVMFLLGGGARPGLFGGRPDLASLDESGDLRHKVDFRSVYATVLGDWFGADPSRILEGRFEPYPVLARPSRT